MNINSNKTESKLVRNTIFGVLVIAIGAITYQWLLPPPQSNGKFQSSELVIPTLSGDGKQGEMAFSKNCAACHGPNAAGSEKGPPLIHEIYNPGHHSDDAFFYAVANGVRSHHWPFGDMPKLPDVSRAELDAIITYVREMQIANGIIYKEHKM